MGNSSSSMALYAPQRQYPKHLRRRSMSRIKPSLFTGPNQINASSGASPTNYFNLAQTGKDGKPLDHSQARFQRTDQWLPIYTWLENLGTDEVIKSKDILDWLTENSEVRQDLYSRHSRYHWMHYIKKLHMKTLKRKERKKGLLLTNKTTTLMVREIVRQNHQLLFRSLSCFNCIPYRQQEVEQSSTDGEVYLAKRSEAFQKFEILVEMEKQLSTLFSMREVSNM